MKIAAAQIACVVGDVDSNVRKIRDFSKRAKSAGADWVVFPEMSDTGYAMQAIRQCATDWNTGAVPELQALAKELALGIICGVSERDGECIFNAQVVIEASGEIVGKYRKTHLFTPAPVEEHTACTPGAEMVALPLGELRVGLGICYDLRFPEFHRALAVDRGANLFVISSAWPFPRVEHLRTLTTARAIENQSYVVLANRVGTDRGVTFCGTSYVIDPYGVVLAEAGADCEELMTAEISAAAVRTVRDGMPVFDHRRPEVYFRSQ
jgi:predicted amidohydrolase